MLKVIVNGYQGRMGQEIVKAVKGDAELEYIAGVDIGDDLEKEIYNCRADVVIDFTHPSVRMETARTIIKSGAHPVIGTTGFTEDNILELTTLCQELSLGAIIAPNFAIGAVLLMKFAQEASKYLDCAEIIELHHEKKEDFPSGTAVKTAQLMLKERTHFNPDVHDKIANIEGARGAKLGGINIHSVRLPGFVAHQEVIFGALGQVFTLRHDSISRESFMPGVLMATKAVMDLNGLIYGLEHLM